MLYRFLSDETRRQGWIYFLLEPGIHYLSVRPPMNLDQCQLIKYSSRWRIDIPTDTRLVYAGTLHFKGVHVKGMFGRSVSFRYWAPVRDEENLAQEVAAKHHSGLGSPLTVLMRRHIIGSTIILRTPNRERGE